jgi:hypothetical protein
MAKASTWLLTLIAGSAAGIYLGVQIADAALK